MQQDIGHEAQPSLKSVNAVGFFTACEPVNPGGVRFRPRLVGGVVDVWKGFWSRDGVLASAGAAEARRCPEGMLSSNYYPNVAYIYGQSPTKK